MNTNPLSDVATIRRVAFFIGAASLVIASFMSFKFGMSMSVLHAAILGLLTLSGSVLFPWAGHLRSSGNKNFVTFMLIGTCFLGAEYFSHVGYTIGQRVMNTEETGVANNTYQLKQVSVKRNSAELEQLHKDLDELKASNDWVATVTPDGLRAQIAPMEEAIRQETKRGGCGPICLSLTEKKAALEDRVAAAERYSQINLAIAEHAKLVNSKEDEAKVAEFKTSPVVAQTSFVAQLATLSLDPDRSALTWTQIGIGALLALVTTFLAPVMFSIAWGPLEYAGSLAGRAKAYAPIPARYAAPQFTPAPPVSVPQVAARAPVAPPQPQQDPFHVHLHQMDANGLLTALQKKLAEMKGPQLAAA